MDHYHRSQVPAEIRWGKAHHETKYTCASLSRGLGDFHRFERLYRLASYRMLLATHPGGWWICLHYALHRLPSAAADGGSRVTTECL